MLVSTICMSNDTPVMFVVVVTYRTFIPESSLKSSSNHWLTWLRFPVVSLYQSAGKLTRVGHYSFLSNPFHSITLVTLSGWNYWLNFNTSKSTKSNNTTLRCQQFFLSYVHLLLVKSRKSDLQYTAKYVDCFNSTPKKLVERTLKVKPP
jgi:hypothetical protein